MAKIIDAIIRLTDNFTPVLDGINKSTDLTVKQFNRLSKDVKKLGDTMSKTGKALSATVTAPVIALGVASVNTYKDFETSMTTVSNLSGATGKDFDDLRSKALELGSSTQWAASEVADAMGYMALAGWDASQMLAETEHMLNLATAAQIGLKEATDIVTDALGAFKMGSEGTQRMVDVLAKTSASSNTDVLQFGEALKQAAALSGSMGYQIEDVALAIGLMGNEFIKGGSAGTVLKNAISNLASPTKDQAALMEQLGITLKDTKNGGALPLIDVIDNLRKVFADMDEVQRAAHLSTLFGKEALAGMTTVITTNAETYNKLKKSIDGSKDSAQEMADAYKNTVQGKIDTFISSLENLQIVIAQKILPYATLFIDKITEVVQWFGKLDDDTQKQIIMFALLSAAVGPIVSVLGSVISTIGTLMPVLAGLKAAFIVASATGGVFAGVMAVLSSPIVIVIGVILALIGVITLLAKNWSKLPEIWDNTKNKILNAINSLKEGFESFKSKCAEVVDNVVGKFTSLKDKVVGIFGKIKDTVSGAFSSAVSGVKNFFGIGQKSTVNTNAIASIPAYASGTNYFKGGLAQINEKGGEIVDLPTGTRIIPHDKSLQVAKAEGKRQAATGGINISIQNMTVREDADIDRIANALLNKIQKQALNMA